MQLKYMTGLTKSLKFAALLGALTLASAAQSAPIVTRFGDSASAVDLNGDFVYAVTANRDAAGRKIGDATFSWMRNTPGFVAGNANAYELARDTQSYYDQPQLNEIMRYWAYNDGSKHFMPDFTNLIPGHTYKWQVLINTTYATSPARVCITDPVPANWDCRRNSELIAIDYQNGEWGYWNYRALGFLYDNEVEKVNALLVSDTFQAFGSTFSLDVMSAGTLSRVNALTLEDITPKSPNPGNTVPEPATMSLVGIGVLGALLSRRRKATTAK